MRKILYGRLSLFALLFFVFFAAVLCGCQKSESSEKDTAAQEESKETESSDGSIWLYYLNAEEDGYKKVSYTLESADDPEAASLEILHMLSDTESSNTDEYKPSVFEGVAVNDISLENGNLAIDFGLGYSQLGNIREALMRTAVVKTVLQLNGVESVSFSVNGSGIQGTDKTPVGVMDEKSILTDDEESAVYDSKRKVKLYYADQTGKKLVACERNLVIEDNVPVETQVLLALKDVPSSKKNLKSPLPEDVEVNQTQVFRNVCYVDLSSDIKNPAADVKEKVTVYAMVNTLAELNTAYQVQFTVDGKSVDELNEFKKFGSLLTSDYSLCE